MKSSAGKKSRRLGTTGKPYPSWNWIY